MSAGQILIKFLAMVGAVVIIGGGLGIMACRLLLPDPDEDNVADQDHHL